MASFCKLNVLYLSVWFTAASAVAVGNVTDATELNKWQSTVTWNCNTPPVKDDLSITPYTRRSDGSQHLLLHGGSLGGSMFSDETWTYNVKGNFWSRIADTDKKPSSRRHHTMVTLCNDTVVLFGGRDNRNQELNETWIFEPAKLKWRSPIISATSDPVPAMYKHASLAVKDNGTSCRCKQSVLVIPGPTKIQCSPLWELRCLQNNTEYEWHKIIPAESKNCPQQGYIRLIAAIGYRNTTLMVLGGDGLWAYEHGQSDGKWIRLSIKRSISIRKDMAFAIFFPILQSYVVVNSPRMILRYSLTSRSWVESERIIGSLPTLLGMGIPAVFDSYALVYRGQSGACRQSMFKVTREIAAWLWIRLQDPALRPSFARQQVLGISRNNLYVTGTPVQWETRAGQLKEMLWRLDLQSSQWFQCSEEIPKGSDGKAFISNSVFLPYKESFVVYRDYLPRELYNFYPAEETWTSFEFEMDDHYPGKRDGHTFVAFNSGSVLLFGGNSQTGGSRKKSNTPLNDLWILEFSGLKPQWTLLEPESTNTTNRPAARSRHVAVVIDSCLLIGGGIRGWSSQLTDLWSYNMSEQSWKLIKPKSSDPGPTGLNRTMSSIGVGHQLLVTVGCTNRLNRETDNCGSGNELQETWMFCPHIGRWTLLSTTDLLSQLFLFSRREESSQFLDGRLLMVENQVSSVLYSFTLACPPGLMSKDVVSTPCHPCRIGTYSSNTRDECIKCPYGLTSESDGSPDITNCSRCVEGFCNHGRCIITQRNHLPAPSCQCHFGFTGDRCHAPTYILIGLALIVIVTLICLSVVYCVNKWRKRQLREGELRRRVEELTSVWQIGHDELRLMDKIGEGGFGRVFKALYREVVVAVKVLTDSGQDEQATLEFEREIVFMQTVRHSNIVMFIGAGIMNDSSRFLVTEYMHRGSLHDVLDAHKSVGLDISQQVKFAIDAAKGMEFLHGLKPVRIHRDLKSFNLLVSKQWVVKVADFGLGRQILTEKRRGFGNNSITSPLLGSNGVNCTTRVGTAQWRAPELCTSQRYGTSADVYRYVKLNFIAIQINESTFLWQFRSCSVGDADWSAAVLSISVSLSNRRRCFSWRTSFRSGQL